MSQALVDFADKRFGTQIQSTAIPRDGYEVCNLLVKGNSSFFQTKSFMAEYYVKCPVEIIVKLPCLVHISSVVIQPKVFSHRSKCIELHTVFQKINKDSSLLYSYQKDAIVSQFTGKRYCSGKKEDGNETQEYFHISSCDYMNDFTLPSVRASMKHFIEQCGKYKEDAKTNTSPNKIVFVNPKHPIQYNTEHPAQNLVVKSHISVKACSYLIIKVTWATIPVLNQLEIWGTLSSYNSAIVFKHFRNLITNVTDAGSKHGTPGNAWVSKPIDVFVESFEKERNIKDIPTEFLDPITCSMMIVPLLLPSGNTVDRSTLEKYVIEEEKYGRLPSDPFTGIVFHGSKQPIPNSSLKCRIDEYILKNDSNLGLNSQTAGLSNNYFNKTMNEFPKNVLNRLTMETSPKFKIKKPDYDKKSYRESITDMHYSDTNTSSKISLKSGSSNHEDKLKSSLNVSLHQTLSLLPVRIKRKFQQEKKIICLRCSEIEEKKLFCLPCQDTYCRKCIQDILYNDKQCILCKQTFKWNDARKLIGNKIII